MILPTRYCLKQCISATLPVLCLTSLLTAEPANPPPFPALAKITEEYNSDRLKAITQLTNRTIARIEALKSQSMKAGNLKEANLAQAEIDRLKLENERLKNLPLPEELITVTPDKVWSGIGARNFLTFQIKEPLAKSYTLTADLTKSLKITSIGSIYLVKGDSSNYRRVGGWDKTVTSSGVLQLDLTKHLRVPGEYTLKFTYEDGGDAMTAEHVLISAK